MSTQDGVVHLEATTPAPPGVSLPSPPPSRGARAAAGALQHLLSLPLLNGPASEPARARAPRCGVEVALLDALARLHERPTYSLLSVPPAARRPPVALRCFYTVAMGADPVASLAFGARHTNHFKFKLSADPALAADTLGRCWAACVREFGEPGDADERPFVWAVDANAAWALSDVPAMTTALAPFAAAIAVIEQPFPVDVAALPETDVAGWEQARLDWHDRFGWLTFADESMRTAADVPALRRVADGGNVKLAKCGGLRAGVRAVETLRAAGMRVWVGIMLGSSLLCSASAQLAGACPGIAWCDLDGPLLIRHPAVRPCFRLVPDDAGRPGVVRLDDPMRGIGATWRSPANARTLCGDGDGETDDVVLGAAAGNAHGSAGLAAH